jgi:hypothetical protein
VKREHIVEALEHAKEQRFERLHLLISVSVWSSNPDKDEIVTDCLLTIAGKLKKGDPVAMLADEFGGIVRNHRLRARQKTRKAKDVLAMGGDEQIERISSQYEDPAALFERTELVKAKIAMLADMKEKKPKQFALLMADYHEMSPIEFFKKIRGETLTPASMWKTRERAGDTVKKGLQEIRKDSSS